MIHTIAEKIDRAHYLYGTRCDALLNDPVLVNLLARIEKLAERSRAVMHELGVVQCCTSCELEEGGSCCGAGIENHYSPTLLLVNLLLGRKLPEKRRWENSCYFLVETGCCLTARQVICVNYLCRKVIEKLSREELLLLQNTTGEEIEVCFAAHEHVQKLLRQLIPEAT